MAYTKKIKISLRRLKSSHNTSVGGINMNKKKIENSCIAALKAYGYNIIEVRDFTMEEDENGIQKCFLETVCHHKEDVKNGYPEEEEVKPFWFNLVPNNSTYKMKDVIPG